MPTVTGFSPQDLRLERSGGVLVRRKGVYLAQLKGSYAEMGRQHGELASAVSADLTPQYVNGLVKNLIAHALPPLAAPAAWLLKELFRRRNRGALGADMRAHLAALAAAYGQPSVMAERLFFVPDIFHYLAGRSFSMLAPPPACSCLFARDAATADGKLLVGRNFDFFGRGVWNTNQALIVMQPDNGRRFCWLGALGVSGSGQGFNESGLFVGLHTNFPGDVSTKGMPIFKIVHDVLSQCGTFEEAIARITAKPRLCGLSLFVVDSKARTAAVVGFSANHYEVLRPENDVLVRANHYLTPEMQRLEVGPHPWKSNSYGRHQRLAECLDAKRGTLTARDIPAILSDCVDPFEGKKVLVGNSLAAPHNIQSLVMSPGDDALWIAHGDLPLCHNDRYLGFRMSAVLEGRFDDCLLEDLSGGAQLDDTERAAMREYLEAWSAYTDHLDAGLAVFHLLRAEELVPGEASFPRMAGLLLLKEKKYTQALPLLMRNAEHDHRYPVMRAEAHVWVGNCLDLMGRRGEAIAQYEIAAKMDAPPVSKAAARFMEKPFGKLHLLNLAPEIMLGTALAKY